VIRDREVVGKRGEDEGGQTLLLVLAMLILLGVLAGALTSLATPSFSHAASVRSLNDTVAATDSGIDYGIQYLKDNAGECPAVIAVPAGFVVNRAALLSCHVVTAVAGSGVSTLLLVSTAEITPTNLMESSAVVGINDDTGSATILSWRTCPSAEC
jgi:hypothetical protein